MNGKKRCVLAKLTHVLISHQTEHFMKCSWNDTLAVNLRIIHAHVRALTIVYRNHRNYFKELLELYKSFDI